MITKKQEVDELTLIECFDALAPQNIASCLYLQPQELIFLGDQAQIDPYLPRYRALLSQRNMNTKITCRYVAMDNIESIVRQLQQILRQEDDFVIDITGGDERVLVAAGAALASLDQRKRRRITLQQFDPLEGAGKPLGKSAYLKGLPVRMSVQEVVQLQGGLLHPYSQQPALRYTAADMDGLWELIRPDSRLWNKTLGILREFESRVGSKTHVFLSLDAIRSGISNFDSKLPQVRQLLAQMDRKGIIEDHSSRDYLEYTYTSPLMRACTEKAGNSLEHKALLEARDLRQQGQPFFHDCLMGVNIVWDGGEHDAHNKVKETRNEVDLILVRGMVPLFVSCKNGDIDEEELYKLHTVTTQFGGPYARKMLIATDLDGKKPGSCGGLIQRAQDMGIYLVADAASLNKEGWAKAFRNAMQYPLAAGKDSMR